MITRIGTYSQVKRSPQKLPCIVSTIGPISLSGVNRLNSD